ncbi:MAG TPA: branched-chain amino acid ABC transporter permease [Syntrophales bacterium]|nr:branched-chain amino acid ABC transporter permease [Syntrophales bacterium]HPN08537.1 branched-chain amino acid ABC transporter permease [Syntrophales bacterium]HPX82096.1 branched-chain amino acid ABC transporter permease [Syntrophales bacterium]HQB13639.1 branched-chain amino acid ABC transporter permease [Syntrophales bacterium]HQK78864.1 branched-chain amino acid ABC transporter permease [Syntrophales bacterium]
MKKAPLAATAIIIVMLAAFPFLSPEVYYLSFMFSVFMYVILASSWNLIGGYAGYLSFGHAAFFGIGAFATAKMAAVFELPPVLTILAAIPAGAIAALVALIIGYPCLKIRGPYFAVVTLCFAFVVDLAVKNIEYLGGAEGIWMQIMDVPEKLSRSIMYEVMLLLMVVTLAVAWWIGRSRLGAGLRAVRSDEEVAETMAIPTARIKIQAFILSAFFPGIAGGLFAYYLTYIHADVVFNINISILIVLMAMFGGGGTWLGPIIGAVILTVVNELLSTFAQAEIARIIYGALFIVVTIFMPNGILDFFRKKNRSR